MIFCSRWRGRRLSPANDFGRYLYAIGGNPDAAAVGINLKRYILAFCLMGALAELASICHKARVGGMPDAGTLMELDAIASCVIGGTSLMGGRGTVWRSAGRIDYRQPRQRHVIRCENWASTWSRRRAGSGDRL